MELSVVITVYNESENIKPLLEATYEALDGIDYEVILVDDGSTDDTVKQIKEHANERVRLVILYRNYGQTAGLAAGFQHATGEYIATLDGDLQNDPADLPVMLKNLKDQEVDVVTGIRKKRKDSMVIRKIPSKIANRMIRWISGARIKDTGCAIRVMKADVAKSLDLYGEMHRFFPVLLELHGGKIYEMDVNHRPRIHGKSKYGLERTVKVLTDLMLIMFFQKYFRRPIHLFGGLGLLLLGAGVVINTYLLVLKIMGEEIWGRPLLILGAVLLLAGIQIISIGIVAEILMRTYYGAHNKTIYQVKEVFVNQEPAKKSVSKVAY
jgi:glycosyltransferase involved in cell wall biosynthesis